MGDNDYGRYCPIAIGSEVLADRWTPLILRELVIGSTRYNDIARGLPGISRSLLSKRLKHLEHHGIVERWPVPGRSSPEYRLTPAGQSLGDVVLGLGRWAVEWLYDAIDEEDVDAVTLMWWMHRFADVSEVPGPRMVIQFDHTAPTKASFWVVIERGGASVCQAHPGFDSDAVVTGTTPMLARVFIGTRSWADAVRSGDITIEGPLPLQRNVPRWFQSSPFAPDVRRVEAARAEAAGA